MRNFILKTLGVSALSLLFTTTPIPADELIRLRGTVVDRTSGTPLPCRLYISNDKGEWYFPKSESAHGSAVEYRRTRGESTEMHTSLSAHPFVIDLPAGTYTLQVERGKEYLPVTETVRLGKEPANITLRLQRWINLAERGWYSGETHVHRSAEDLPACMLAEDLNVAFPLTFWVTKGFVPPSTGNKATAPVAPAKLIELDQTHVIWPYNTEWEIFTIHDKPNALGAVFAINHREAFNVGAPPVRPIAEQVRKQGALLELDKHNWPWSMMLVPIMNVDLFELTNNHVWRTTFAFRKFGEQAPAYMGIEQDDAGFTERGWVEFGFQNYYALLNCGFRMRPTAGTASGVHPVPLGFGRVYVSLPDGFQYDRWVAGLNAGRSFVTTGPMLLATVNGQGPGHRFQVAENETQQFRVSGSALSEQPLERIELISAGEVLQIIKPQSQARADGGFESLFDVKLPVSQSTWLAVRCFETRPHQRFRFAHTAPVHIDVAGKPLRPRKVEVEFLAARVKTQLERLREVVPEDSLQEYRQALEIYEGFGKTAR